MKNGYIVTRDIRYLHINIIGLYQQTLRKYQPLKKFTLQSIINENKTKYKGIS